MANNKQFTQDFLKDMPAWAKGTMGVVVIGGVAFGVFKLYKYIQNQGALEGAKAEQKATTSALDKLAQKGVKPSYDQVQYNTLANQLATAFNGYGTDTSAVFRAFTYMKNNADVIKLNQVFGIKKISSGKFNVSDDFEGTLAQHLTEELNAKELQALNSGLAKKGISYRY
jgi:hypothetical protein